MTPIEPVGPVDRRPKPVERTLAAERSRRPAQRDPERDARQRDRPQRDGQAPEDGHVDVRA